MVAFATFLNDPVERGLPDRLQEKFEGSRQETALEEDARMPLTRALGQFVADLSPNRLPEEALKIAGLGIADCVGIMIAGGNEPCVQILKRVRAPVEGAGISLLQGEKGPGPEAGWVKGTAAQASTPMTSRRGARAPLGHSRSCHPGSRHQPTPGLAGEQNDESYRLHHRET